MAKQGMRGTRGQENEEGESASGWTSLGMMNWSKQKLRKTKKSRSFWVWGGQERLKLTTESRDKTKKDTFAISDFLGWAKFESG
jgi:hypothetical protein